MKDMGVESVINVEKILEFSVNTVKHMICGGKRIVLKLSETFSLVVYKNYKLISNCVSFSLLES
jgi:hypothetical protein